eukprot:8464586-Lingulodinium_polyedra.AAC.1
MDVPPPLPPQDDQHICYDCGAILRSSKAWHLHRRHVHGHRRAAVAYAHGAVCLACGLENHEVARLIQHYKSPK